jgi:hypothetical protein
VWRGALGGGRAWPEADENNGRRQRLWAAEDRSAEARAEWENLSALTTSERIGIALGLAAQPAYVEVGHP